MAFGTVIPLCDHCLSNVSILVFLEWPLGQDRLVPDDGPVPKFQSLFFWNGLWDGGQDAGDVQAQMFQSLFFWNGLWDKENL